MYAWSPRPRWRGSVWRTAAQCSPPGHPARSAATPYNKKLSKKINRIPARLITSFFALPHISPFTPINEINDLLLQKNKLGFFYRKKVKKRYASLPRSKFLVSNTDDVYQDLQRSGAAFSHRCKHSLWIILTFLKVSFKQGTSIFTLTYVC